MRSMIKNYHALIVVCVGVLITACSSGSSDPSGGGPAVLSVPENTLNKRIKTVAIDLDRDGTVDSIVTYNYDDKNRVASREVEDFTTPSRSETITYNYQGERLISKESTKAVKKDTHTYENNLLTASSRFWDGDHSYQYNEQGRLIGSTGEDFFYNDDCDFQFTSPDTYQDPTFTISYAGGKPKTVATTDGQYNVVFNYEGSLLSSFRSTYNCDANDPDSTLVSTTSFTRNSAGRATRIQVLDPFFFSDISVTYGANGKATKLVDSRRDGDITTDITYNDDGLTIQTDVTHNIQSAFAPLEYTVNYGYEDGTCVVSFSSNPASLVIVDALIGPEGVDPYANCGHSLDHNEF